MYQAVEKKRVAHKILVRKLEGRIPCGGDWCCWDDTEMGV
jgi:hypothetical protein